MIRCFKCGTPATQDPDGTVQRSCDCYQPSFIYTYPPAILSPSTMATHVPIHNESAKDVKHKDCPLCGVPIIAPGFHQCRGIGSVPAPQSESDEISQDRARRIHAMLTDRLIVHRENCAGCKALGRSCFEIRNIEDLQEKWRKKAGIP